MRVNMPRGCYRGVFSVSNLYSPKFGRTRIDESRHKNVSSLSETFFVKIFAAMKNILAKAQCGGLHGSNIATGDELSLNLDEK
jgi:hypothetical protein